MLRNGRPNRTGKITYAANSDMQVNNQVFSTVEHKYSLMDEQHARIRAEALASNNPKISNSKTSVEPKFRET